METYIELPLETPGSPGESAYQVAVNNGFVGTETAWLASLVGPTGPAGSIDLTGLTQATPIISDFIPFINGVIAYKASLNEMPVSAPQNLNSIVNAIIFG